MDELNDAQIDIIYTKATAKNAVDAKLSSCMRRFVNATGSPATVILLSSDINFAFDLYDFKYRHQIEVIVIYQGHVSPSLIACADEVYNFSIFTENLPLLRISKATPVQVTVTNLPQELSSETIKNHLLMLTDNCKGRIISIKKDSAVLKFPTAVSAFRAQRRLDNKILGSSQIQAKIQGTIGKNEVTSDASESTSIHASLSEVVQTFFEKTTIRLPTEVQLESLDTTPIDFVNIGVDTSRSPDNFPVFTNEIKEDDSSDSESETHASHSLEKKAKRKRDS
ncbi:Meiosis regulator and mRNA stability factor 1 [Araneus ventricosus]|uniref:Meiosis regulator and mRNA stability factor 1 n=1 Tax=Araneus ventricosus TaxID=182803 RepID=A0A4Y2NP95_ARAVE|nr:Meiosis regulator and mRNA stability factor 1 [Araneus ventricosus]